MAANYTRKIIRRKQLSAEMDKDNNKKSNRTPNGNGRQNWQNQNRNSGNDSPKGYGRQVSFFQF